VRRWSRKDRDSKEEEEEGSEEEEEDEDEDGVEESAAVRSQRKGTKSGSRGCRDHPEAYMG